MGASQPPVLLKHFLGWNSGFFITHKHTLQNSIIRHTQQLVKVFSTTKPQTWPHFPNYLDSLPICKYIYIWIKWIVDRSILKIGKLEFDSGCCHPNTIDDLSKSFRYGSFFSETTLFYYPIQYYKIQLKLLTNTENKITCKFKISKITYHRCVLSFFFFTLSTKTGTILVCY